MTPIVSATILRAQSDERLLTLTRQGYERAFEAIVERYRRPMMRYCRRYLPEARAEDAVQQTFISAWSAIRDGTDVADLRAWLYRITRNAAIDAAKRGGYDYHELTEALRLTPAPDAELERRAVMRETLTGVAGLPTNQREALLRTVVEGQSRADIARDMQISEGAVRQLVHRARMALRSAATSLTPAPVIGWAASLGGPDAPVSARIAELAAGGGAAGGAGLLVKTGTAVMVAGVLAVEAGTHLEHPTPAAGDSAAPARAKPARAAVSHPGTRHRVARSRPHRTSAWSAARPGPRAASTAGERSGDESSTRSGRERSILSPVSGTVTHSGQDGDDETSANRAGGDDGGGGDGQEDNSGPGSQSSGDEGDGDHSGSDGGGDGDGDHSGSDDGGGDHSGSDDGGGDSKSGDSGGDKGDSGGGGSDGKD